MGPLTGANLSPIYGFHKNTTGKGTGYPLPSTVFIFYLRTFIQIRYLIPRLENLLIQIILKQNLHQIPIILISHPTPIINFSYNILQIKHIGFLKGFSRQFLYQTRYLLNTNSQVRFREFIYFIPPQRSKFLPFLYHGVKKT